MKENQISARGERAAISGYLPQFDEFARFVYINLINKSLIWIRVADPEAEKLDDILYATNNEIHAYQIKWTIADATITYKNFLELFPLLFSSYKKLKKTNPSKIIIPHLITNKKASQNDKIKLQDDSTADFATFLSDVLEKIKRGTSPEKKWNNLITELQNFCGGYDDFINFISVLDFQTNYVQKTFTIQNSRLHKDEQDLTDLSRFIFEKAADSKRIVEFSRSQIINELRWADRFSTVFNHEITHDSPLYQPIRATIDELDNMYNIITTGYIFLVGGPGSGKSTLLNRWTKGLKEDVVKYYAFDFLNPSSAKNFYERGNAVNLFFDLVNQLKDSGCYHGEVLPYKDILFLKDIFNEQLRILGDKFEASQEKTVILIDGLDHVPREYKEVANSFLKELPLPDALPEGVVIILGSQSFELKDLPQEIRKVYSFGDRTVKMSSLTKDNVHKYIEALSLNKPVTISEKDLIFQKSQGHPLYLNYIAGWLEKRDSIGDLLNELPEIDGNIENYYMKLWEPIAGNAQLIELLGLLARINGSINTDFMQEWDFPAITIKEFRDTAKILFTQENKYISFFHNSFRQFLITETALNYFSNGLNEKRDRDFHQRLAELYFASGKEKGWKANYHLFYGGDYDKFIEVVDASHLTNQLLELRPPDAVKQDAKLGIEIARRTQNLKLLLRYLFCLSEIQSRLSIYNPSSFIEELLAINKIQEATECLRNGKTLTVDNDVALKSSRLFIEKEIRSEARQLYDLAYPDIVNNNSITIDDNHQFEESKNLLEEWVQTATYFETTESLLDKIFNIQLPDDYDTYETDNPAKDLLNFLLLELGYSLISQNRWEDFEKVISKLETGDVAMRNTLLQLLKDAILECLEQNDKNRSYHFLEIIKKEFRKEKITNEYGRVYIADLVYAVTADTDESYSWIEGIEHPTTEQIAKNLGYGDTLTEFEHQIRLNKLLNLCDKNKSLSEAIPSETGEEEILAKYQRILFLITKIETDIIKKCEIQNLVDRISPIVRFFYRDFHPRFKYSYKIGKTKNSTIEYLIDSVAPAGGSVIGKLANYLFNEFSAYPKYWNPDTKRRIINCLLENGLDHGIAEVQLRNIEDDMLAGLDLDARVSECLSHAKTYQLLNKLDDAEFWLKESCLQSFGVGYRKDYQYSTWIEWLKKINKYEPERAPERLNYFLSHLQHIKDTTEGRAYLEATADILKAGLEHNLHTGLKILIWQTQRGLIDFTEGTRLLIDELVKVCSSKNDFDMILSLYKNLFLILAKDESSDLLKSILEKGYKVFGIAFFSLYITELIHNIKTKSFEGNRHDFLKCIQKFLDSADVDEAKILLPIEIPPIIGRRSDNSATNSIVLKNPYRTLDERQVLALVTNFDLLQNIILDEDQSNSYFDWSSVIKKLPFELSIPEVKQLINSIHPRKRESGFFSNLSAIALKNGDRKLATDLAEKSLSISGESGWSVGYDGGSRINAFNALRNIDSKKSSDKAFEIFCQDVLASNYPTFFVSELENILPLIDENISVQDVWLEVFDYFKRLMGNSNMSTELPTLSTNDNISTTIIDYLVFTSLFSLPFLQERIQKIFAEYLLKEDHYAVEIIRSNKLDENCRFAILLHLFERDSLAAETFIEDFKFYAVSLNVEYRIIAKRILTQYNENIPNPKNIAIPGLYSIHLHESADLSSSTGDISFDSDEKSSYLKPFFYLIKILSAVSLLPEQNILFRVLHLKKEFENKNPIPYSLSELKYILNEAELHYSLVNPQLFSTRTAIMMAAGELIDCGIIEEVEIAQYFEMIDSGLLDFPEAEKPNFIGEIKEDEYGGLNDDWVNRVASNVRLNDPIKHVDYNFLVIAEHSFLKNLTWDLPTEIFMTQISPDENFHHFGTGNRYETLIVRQSKNYFDLTECGDKIIIKRKPVLNYDGIKNNWIAFNPELARKFGWIPDEQLFAWKSKDQEVMAKSIYWLNGNVEMGTRYDGEVGEGWYVVISHKALGQLQKEFKNLFFQKKVIRHSSKNIAEVDNIKKVT
ncbi:NACHT domain-containing protein [Chryseobacterium luquanense]|uniref:ATP-binding protein n=1 Tax=Chryseobacterium luquanense TaxID=2983766 RepID=A0ABT3Y8G0_9FLAO|nr:ATP-binding protein [Chryseobacterium luquanense]MCX8534346.1 ATP-binding protein [Chryseobacterium luquanense]